MKNFFLYLFRFLISFGYRTSVKTNVQLPVAMPKSSLKNDKISFFIVAHPDDIELFMGREARHRITDSPKQKKVFVVLTAGDANRKNKKKIFRKITWWEAREKAHTQAISSWNNHQDPIIETEVKINTRKISKTTIGTAIILYNLRLTDADKNTSLDDLLHKKSSSIFDLVYNQAYTLIDIQQTLLEIIYKESKDTEEASFHIMDESYDRNPNDHKDHKATSLLFREIYTKIDLPKKSLNGYLTYHINTKPINLEGEDKLKSFETWEIMANELDSNGYKRNDDKHHMQWVGKEYKSYTLIPEESNKA